MTTVASIVLSVVVSIVVSYTVTCWAVDRGWRKVLREQRRVARRAYDRDMADAEWAAKLDRDRRLT